MSRENLQYPLLCICLTFFVRRILVYLITLGTLENCQVDARQVVVYRVVWPDTKTHTKPSQSIALCKRGIKGISTPVTILDYYHDPIRVPFPSLSNPGYRRQSHQALPAFSGLCSSSSLSGSSPLADFLNLGLSSARESANLRFW